MLMWGLMRGDLGLWVSPRSAAILRELRLLLSMWSSQSVHAEAVVKEPAHQVAGPESPATLKGG
jgi:hypothetical protein